MLTLFYPPFRAADDVEMLELAVKGIRAYAEDLSDLSPDVLRRAWRETRRGHKVERWPTIQAILAAADGLSDRRRGELPGHYRPATPEDEEAQRIAYGGVHMTRVRPEDAAWHRQQAEDRRQGVKGGPRYYNPFAAGRAA